MAMRIKECLMGVVRRIGLYLKDRRGAQTVEWVALGLLVLAIMMGAASYVSSKGEGEDTIGQVVIDKIGAVLENINTDEK